MRLYVCPWPFCSYHEVLLKVILEHALLCLDGGLSVSQYSFVLRSSFDETIWEICLSFIVVPCFFSRQSHISYKQLPRWFFSVAKIKIVPLKYDKYPIYIFINIMLLIFKCTHYLSCYTWLLFWGYSVSIIFYY